MVQLYDRTADDAPPPSDMHLVMCPHKGSSRANVTFPPELRYVANRLRLGMPIEAYYRFHRLLGLPSENTYFAQLHSSDEAAIAAEITAAACPITDSAGWTDTDWMAYLLSDIAGRPSKPRGGSTEAVDQGNDGKTLDEFAQHPLAIAANLSRAHVFALRLYSTPLHSRLNQPFHDGCIQPHPYSTLVIKLVDAWQRLATAAADKPSLFAKFGALGVAEEGPASKPVLWRVFNSADDVGEYKQRGCLEMGFVSTMRTRAAAEAAAIRLGTANRLDRLTLLKLKTEKIVDISPWSVYPAEGECFLPPCTSMLFRSEATVTSKMTVGKDEGETVEVPFRVIDAMPTLFALPVERAVEKVHQDSNAKVATPGTVAASK